MEEICNKWEEKMLPNIQKIVNEINNKYFTNFKITTENRTADLQRVVDYLYEYCYENNAAFIFDRGKRKANIRDNHI